jgi:outer membrane protein assembly factor BamB
VAGSIVFTGNRNGMIHALRAADGVEIWRSSAGNIDGLVTGRNAVYIRNQIGEVRALRSENGREIWRVATRGLVSWVTEAQGTVYVCSNNLYAVRAADGRRLWSFPVESTGPAGLITAPGVVYVGSGSSMYALRA